MSDYTDRAPDGSYLRESDRDVEDTPAGEDTWQGVYPGMCIDPEICRGRGSCPRNYSCCE